MPLRLAEQLAEVDLDATVGALGALVDVERGRPTGTAPGHGYGHLVALDLDELQGGTVLVTHGGPAFDRHLVGTTQAGRENDPGILGGGSRSPRTPDGDHRDSGDRQTRTTLGERHVHAHDSFVSP